MPIHQRAKVLFVCLGNSCRSPMAESIARRDASDVIEASSAGLTPLGHIEGMTLETLVRNGCPTDGLSSKPLLRSAFDAADVVINMSGWRREQAFSDSAKVKDWHVEDPYGADAETYQRDFDDIERRVAQLADLLRTSESFKLPVEDIKDASRHSR